MKILFNFSIVFFVSLGLYAQAPKNIANDQASEKDTVPYTLIQTVFVPRVQAAKTDANSDLLSEFYQMGLSDLTGNTKGLTFVASIYAIKSGFKSNSASKPNYFENNFQPDVTVGYKNNFQNLNTSFGFKFALINQTDSKHSKKLNYDRVLLNYWQELNNLDSAFRTRLNGNMNALWNDQAKLTQARKGYDPNSETGKAMVKAYRNGLLQQYKNDLKALTALELNGDASQLSPELLALYYSTTPNSGRLQTVEKQAKAHLDSVSKVVANGWNVNINPMVTYDFTHGGFQGVNLGASSIKGWSIIDTGHTSQLVAKFNYVIGTDTIVSKINTARKEITDQVGFNQVLATSLTKSASKSVPTPCLEASFTGSYNYVYSGLKPKEKNAQPALNIKLGLLIGKSTWFTLPVSYNFGLKTTTAMFSVQANIGSAPF